MTVDLLESRWVVFPHYPNWTRRPEWFRLWDSEVGSAETGKEYRVATSVRGRHGIRFQVTAYDIRERSQIVDRLTAIKMTGEAVVPFWGRGCELLTATSGRNITLRRTPAFEWATGDWMFIRSSGAHAFDEWELFQVNAVEGTTVQAVEDLSRTYAKGCFIWPLLKGKATFDALDLFNSRRMEFALTVRENEVREKPVPDECAIYPAGLALEGSGGDSFECYDLGVPEGTLGSGTGFSAAWVFTDGIIGPVAIDDGEDYSLGTAVTLNKGTGWAGAWALTSFDFNSAEDDIESYSLGVAGTLNGGSGFAAAWVLSGLIVETLQAEEDFEGYSIGQSSGLNGGTGFSADWSLSGTVLFD